jgi:ribonuclease P protein component
MAPEPGAPALETIKKRRDFLAAARARKAPARAFLLQARNRREDHPGPPRIGYTASKKVGGAVARNRAKRRLRALAREALAPAARPGWDYVLIARADETVSRPFDAMRRDLADALARAHAPGKPRKPKP